jgi:allantoate deiminase
LHDCHRELAKWLEAVGVSPTIDPVGNLRALYPGSDPVAPRLLIGSHLDTVPNAGAFDGVLGVVLAVTLLDVLEGRRLPFAIEIIGFSEEEGVRFGIPFIGSRALAGTINEEILRSKDSEGISVREAIEQFGLDPTQIPEASLRGEILGYVEFHIEQGPVLESLDLSLAAVEAIAGQTRQQFTFTGRTNHAGTTPINLRHDALAAAAEWITAVEREARSIPGLVATVGAIEAKPGATNVIAGEVQASLDIRHASDKIRTHSMQAIAARAKEIAQVRGLEVKHTISLDQRAVVMDSFLVAEIDQAIRETGCRPHRMVSGAGHDAMIMAERVPAAMIFLRSPGGISHDPAEAVLVEDVARGIECGMHLLTQLASTSKFHGRTCLA